MATATNTMRRSITYVAKSIHTSGASTNSRKSQILAW
jgi:hypothetical protein